MIFSLETNLIKKEKYYYVKLSNCTLRLDYYFDDNLDLDQKHTFYFYYLQETNFKNKTISRLYCFAQEKYLNLFLDLYDLNGMGINTLINIFNCGINDFVKAILNSDNQLMQSKYKLNIKQINSINEKYAKQQTNKLQDKQKQSIKQNLVSLGFNKQLVNKIIDINVNEFINLSIEEVIKKFVRLSNNESKEL